MKKSLKKFCFLFLSISCFFVVERLCHRATDGFMISKILHKTPQNPKWNITFSEKSQLNDIICQPFHYLNSGSQFYAFESEDHKTVIKFFKFQHMRIRPIFQYLPFFGSWKQWKDKKMQKKNALIARTFSSIKLAFDLLKDETGLIYLQLNPQNDGIHPLRIIDKIGIAHEVNLNQMAFVVQKKSKLAYEQIEDWMRDGQVEKASHGIHQLIELSLLRCLKGVGDIDPDFSTNFGFVDGMAVQIDIGRFYEDETRKDPIEYRNEMIRITRDFRKWIAKNYPLLLNKFDAKITNL